MLSNDFYKIIHSEETAPSVYSTSLKIDKNHKIFDGHFPERPVTPGVVLMQLFKEDLERIQKQKLRFVRGNNIKFMAVFDPTDCDELILESEIENAGEFVKLKGIAKNSKGMVLKINSLYSKK